ncbi:MAG: PEP-CTERM sorting domain-containing protein [Planctomycetaceae bacterium]
MPTIVRYLLVCTTLGLPAARAVADRILITEVVTDPQGDHSESSGGNGIPFDAIPGNGTVSDTDEFVELFNAARLVVDLTGWVLEFQDTSPSRFVFGVDSGILRFSGGSTLTAFLPGTFLLLGNPPGALNNRVDVLLLDSLGITEDALRIQNGAASSAWDEAVARQGAQEGPLLEVRAPISPLGGLLVQQPTPEPGSILLVGISGLVAALATARRARRARLRRPPGGPPPPAPGPGAL